MAKNIRIPGVSFSLKRALGVTKLKRAFTKRTGIPTTRSGIERKIGCFIFKSLLKNKE